VTNRPSAPPGLSACRCRVASRRALPSCARGADSVRDNECWNSPARNGRIHRGQGGQSNTVRPLRRLREAAVLAGVRVERSESGDPGDFAKLSEKEIDELLAAEFSRLTAIPANDAPSDALADHAQRNDDRRAQAAQSHCPRLVATRRHGLMYSVRRRPQPQQSNCSASQIIAPSPTPSAGVSPS
jgi:hypothetical protein